MFYSGTSRRLQYGVVYGGDIERLQIDAARWAANRVLKLVEPVLSDYEVSRYNGGGRALDEVSDFIENLTSDNFNENY